MVTSTLGVGPEQTDEREPEQAGWLASLGTVNSRPRYPDRSVLNFAG